MIDNLKIGETIVILLGAGFVAFLLSIFAGLGSSMVKRWSWSRNGVDRRSDSNNFNPIQDIEQKIRHIEERSEERANKYIPIIEGHNSRIIALEIQYKTIIEMLTEIKRDINSK